ncbi:hypothetical protein GCM10007276_20610 [Agaricicola taiwanensis]|uniref:DUF4142 domain-containing protein n=1 Tax=Agaricicola taiwanensis TaxID=591372 RepID=A0A8J2YHK0_9RHOB|nr:DUF4142 domain-containing protein [Agaricicola taiwanensis]GGE43220.1 hypothetical protein GCM10007276_20610 [Agaricicola taiwanensis]
MIYKSLLAGAMMMAAVPAVAQSGGSTSTQAMTGAQFVEVATISNLFEIQSSQAALEKAQTEEVKAFAQQMIDDHTKAANDMKAAVAKAGGDMKMPTALDAEHQKILDDLNAETGDDFDEEYVDAQVDAHEKAVALFTTYSKSGDQPALKDFATKTLPVLQKHYDHIQKMD